MKKFTVTFSAFLIFIFCGQFAKAGQREITDELSIEEAVQIQIHLEKVFGRKVDFALTQSALLRMRFEKASKIAETQKDPKIKEYYRLRAEFFKETARAYLLFRFIAIEIDEIKAQLEVEYKRNPKRPTISRKLAQRIQNIRRQMIWGMMINAAVGSDCVKVELWEEENCTKDGTCDISLRINRWSLTRFMDRVIEKIKILDDLPPVRRGRFNAKTAKPALMGQVFLFDLSTAYSYLQLFPQ